MAASSQNASGSAVPSTATSSPATVNPTTSAIVSPIHIAELAVTSSSSSTICGSTATLAGRKKIEIVVTRNTSG